MYHPDVNKDASAKEKFSEINVAYETLSDDSKRNSYNVQQHNQQHQHADYDFFYKRYHRDEAEEDNEEEDFDATFDFEDMFYTYGRRNGAKRRKQQKHAKPQQLNVQRNVTISLKDSVLGTHKDVKCKIASECKSCHGDGFVEHDKMGKCPKCRGLGFTSVDDHSMAVCNLCYGKKRVQKTICNTCDGVGFEYEPKTYTVTIPEGVEDGSILKLRGLGKRSGTHVGDMLLTINIEKDDKFKRKGEQLETFVSIPFVTAIVGGTAQVKHVTGESINVAVPQGTQLGDFVVIKGKGVKRQQQGDYGDLLVRLKIMLPKWHQLSTRQRELLQEFNLLEKHK